MSDSEAATPLKEETIGARLNHLDFDLEREPGGFDWIVRDRRGCNRYAGLAAHKVRRS
jgi:hypothetical protein